VNKKDKNKRKRDSDSIERERMFLRNQQMQAIVKCISKFTLVDLAGSERLSEGEKTLDRIEEAKYINKSLAALGNVIFNLKN